MGGRTYCTATLNHVANPVYPPWCLTRHEQEILTKQYFKGNQEEINYIWALVTIVWFLYAAIWPYLWTCNLITLSDSIEILSTKGKDKHKNKHKFKTLGVGSFIKFNQTAMGRSGWDIWFILRLLVDLLKTYFFFWNINQTPPWSVFGP